jgi:hypothetical protein
VTSAEGRGHRFSRGDHLKVRRTGYFHHGVYVSDDRVVEFGGRIWDKPSARIQAVSLACFERGGTAVVVSHPSRTLVGWLPSAVTPHEIVMRAEFLIENTPANRYNLAGFNCETAANWCACGGYSESHQTRTFFGIGTIAGGACMLWTAKRARDQQPIHWWVLAPGTVTTALVVAYNMAIRSFWRDIGHSWAEYDRRAREP